MPEYLESNVQGCLIDPLVEHSQGNDVQKPRYQFSDLLHISVGRGLQILVCKNTRKIRHTAGMNSKTRCVCCLPCNIFSR